MLLSAGSKVRGVLQRGGFDPAAALLANSTLLIQFDNSDLSTMFQDRAGTVPVTAPGQVVGYQTAKGSPGIARTAINDTTRGVYQTDGTRHWIVFDGLNTAYTTASITPGADRVQVFWAGRKLTNGTSVLIECGNTATVFGGFTLAIDSSSTRYYYSGRGNRTSSADDQASVNGFAAPDTAVLTALQGINSGAASRLRRNGGAYSNSVNTTFNGGAFGTLPLNYGRRSLSAAFPFNGLEYNSIVRFSTADLSDDLIAQTERYLANKAGVTL